MGRRVRAATDQKACGRRRGTFGVQCSAARARSPRAALPPTARVRAQGRAGGGAGASPAPHTAPSWWPIHWHAFWDGVQAGAEGRPSPPGPVPRGRPEGNVSTTWFFCLALSACFCLGLLTPAPPGVSARPTSACALLATLHDKAAGRGEWAGRAGRVAGRARGAKTTSPFSTRGRALFLFFLVCPLLAFHSPCQRRPSMSQGLASLAGY